MITAIASFDGDYPKSFGIRWPISVPLSSSSGNVITEPPKAHWYKKRFKRTL